MTEGHALVKDIGGVLPGLGLGQAHLVALNVELGAIGCGIRLDPGYSDLLGGQNADRGPIGAGECQREAGMTLTSSRKAVTEIERVLALLAFVDEDKHEAALDVVGRQ